MIIMIISQNKYCIKEIYFKKNKNKYYIKNYKKIRHLKVKSVLKKRYSFLAINFGKASFSEKKLTEN